MRCSYRCKHRSKDIVLFSTRLDISFAELFIQLRIMQDLVGFKIGPNHIASSWKVVLECPGRYDRLQAGGPVFGSRLDPVMISRLSWLESLSLSQKLS